MYLLQNEFNQRHSNKKSSFELNNDKEVRKLSEEKLKLWRIPTRYCPEETFFVVTRTEERALELIRENLKKDGYEEEEDYDFDYPECWELEEDTILEDVIE